MMLEGYAQALTRCWPWLAGGSPAMQLFGRTYLSRISYLFEVHHWTLTELAAYIAKVEPECGTCNCAECRCQPVGRELVREMAVAGQG